MTAIPHVTVMSDHDDMDSVEGKGRRHRLELNSFLIVFFLYYLQIQFHKTVYASRHNTSNAHAYMYHSWANMLMLSVENAYFKMQDQK